MPAPRTRRTQRFHDKVELLGYSSTPNADIPTETTDSWASYNPARFEYWTVQPGSRDDQAATDRARLDGLVRFIAPTTSIHAIVGSRFVWQGDVYEVTTELGLVRGNPSGTAELVAEDA